jgi:ribose/xylose/arabinose/galactoside ABC-type transport system permease subunit
MIEGTPLILEVQPQNEHKNYTNTHFTGACPDTRRHLYVYNRFILNARNIVELLRESSMVALCAGRCLFIIGGGFDLSTGESSRCAALSARGCRLYPHAGNVVLLGVSSPASCGAINAVLVTRVHLTEFVATLASGFVFRVLRCSLPSERAESLNRKSSQMPALRF